MKQPMSKVSEAPVLFNPAESFIKNIENFQNNLPKSSAVKSSICENPVKTGANKKKNILWESADINSKSNTKLNLFAANRNRTSIQRPHSAFQKSFKDKRIKNEEEVHIDEVVDNQGILVETKKSVLFDYKKLNEIEMNIENAISNSQKSLKIRPKSALEDRKTDLAFNLSAIEVPTPTVDGSSQIFQTNNNLLAKYSNTNPNVEETNQNKIEQVSVDWCSLPQELWLNIIMLLNQKDLSQFGRTCKVFSKIYKDKTLCKLK